MNVMPSWPRLSIVTPSYNQAQFLETTIQRVLSQDYPNLEYMIVDGGSTDGSVEIIHRYQDRLAYWVSEPDKGQTDAINKGFLRATGDIVTWLNSDDYYLPGTLHRVADHFVRCPDVECVYGDLHIVDEQGGLFYVSKSMPYHYRTMLYGGAYVPQPASFYRRRAIARVGYLYHTLHHTMDVEYFIRFGKNGVRFSHMDEPLTCFRIHSMNKTQERARFTRELRQVTSRYTRRYSHNERVQLLILDLLQAIFRLRSFATRAITRGDFVPLRARWARWKARH